ncbi:hypothetical protein GCM10019016_044640 [Streptomyces prasinosporus]|uniref:Uncharacterized protein n=1 Tax=Streptomyces prasinosporus TaxID=68256 RepID=A0ABP6TPY3_9ACTN|nr:hypothetical protein GCM10010332_63710 [Streptomyces albogriseolus]GHG30182.1 hypothetical protein GCM10018777_52150 [Streptomyces viridodiastaticus]
MTAFVERFQALEQGLGQGPCVDRAHLVVRGDLRESGEETVLDDSQVVLLDGIQMFRKGCRRRFTGRRCVEPG